ncbi:polysaccharide biosynthesis tyrosine autokinase [candidate division KSB1 bacterium]|nr:polysaccharide biosynthesis tyrosine autokinase [candidate division KSB1 bacterium]
MEDLDFLQGTGEEEALQIDFGKFLRGFWKRKFIIAFFAIVSAGYFYWQAKNEVPIYSTYVTIKTKEFTSESGAILSRGRQAELRSRSFSERVTAQMGLALKLGGGISEDQSPFAEFFTSNHPVPGRYSLRVSNAGICYLSIFQSSQAVVVDSLSIWDAVESTHDVNGFTFRLKPEFVNRPHEFIFQIKPFERAVSEFKSSITAEVNKNGTIMVLTMRGTDPTNLAEKINQIADVYVQETLKLKDRDVNSYRRRLMASLEIAEEKVRETDEALREFNRRYPLSLTAAKNAIVDELQTCNRTLREIPDQRQQLSQLLDRLQQSTSGTDPERYRRLIVRQLAHFTAMAREPALALLRDQLEDQESRYALLYKDYSTDYPPLTELNTQIRETQDNIIAFASNFRNTLAERETEARSKLEEIEMRMQKLPDDEYRLVDLQRNKKIAEEQYNSLLEKISKMDISDVVVEDEIAILDRAIRPTSPINPSKKQKIFIGAGLGLILGMALSLGLDIADRSLRTPEEVEKYLKLPVMGAIPVVNFKDIPEYHDFEKAKQIDRQLVTHDYSPTPIGEAYRSLRTHLMFSRKNERIRTLLLTSVAPEEGKSFTASNLAIIFAQQRSNTLLVDADLRRGVLHNTFHMHKEPGLANYLSNSATLSSVVQQTHIPNLSFISCGALVPNPSELLGSLFMKRFLDEAVRKFDTILFDTPPLEAATDAVVLGTQVQAIVVVVRSGKTNRKLAQERLDIFQSVPANLVGVVMNGSEKTLVKNYSYYHY